MSGFRWATLVFVIMEMSFSSFAQKTPWFDIEGHRGARGLRPENSIPAFILALDSGVTTVEMDLAITKDRQIVVSHEPWMSSAICLKPDGAPITKKEEKTHNIYQMTYDEVRRFDCGSIGNLDFPGQQKMMTSKPLLQDVIVAIEDHLKSKTRFEVDYNLEIKTEKATDNKYHPSPEQFSDMVYNLVDQYLPWERIIIQSFDFRVLKYWHEKHPKVRLSALVEDTGEPESHLNALGFNPAIYSPYYRLLTAEKISWLHERGIKVIPWTVNEPGEMLALKGMGVDGFITDYPGRAARFKRTLNIEPKAK
jgi:glycerophosphoryl diester phosphodiesterase